MLPLGNAETAPASIGKVLGDGNQDSIKRCSGSSVEGAGSKPGPWADGFVFGESSGAETKLERTTVESLKWI